MPETVDLPTSLDLTDLDAGALTRLFTSRRRFSFELMFRTALVHKHRRVTEGLDRPPRRNLRALYYTYGRPLAVATGHSHKRPYSAFLNAFNDLVRAGRLSYADLSITDELWENRRIGATHPGVVVITEKEGQIRLLRYLHDRLDVTIQAFRGNPSAVTASYLATHVRAALQPHHRLALVAIVDWDPFGYQIAHAVADMLRRFDLPLPDPVLVVTPDHFTPREVEMHGYPPRVAPRHRRLHARWAAASPHPPVGLASDALPRERLLRLAIQVIQSTLR